ncbi:polysaccharide biosynthesis protein [Candidatus Symbiobacter mobilis]|uniref:Nucleoside-diphosphate sugar epimerase-like protein n=1 Tax=Candidatus Symbiobacter mobilis CR TaxID=946483 RepID=U5N8M8_9BURK|nr:nucleoside-diphosphate sugar epimerase/dehydratase [Candidatus Symbiobacter mobilis]AGX87881.1 nucleoside-diphosphate sugar epimerase-like protein [Candidatus Symbiobacter mobilis CR]
MRDWVLGWPRPAKQATVVTLDVALSLLATAVAFALRLDTLEWPTPAQWQMYAVAPALAIPLFARFGLYRAIFRYTGQAALDATARAVLVYACLLTILLLWVRWPMVPRTLGVLQPLVFFLLVGASRAVARFWLAGIWPARPCARVLIFGAGAIGVQAASALRACGGFELLAFLDDDDRKVGRNINGVPVVAASQMRDWVTRCEVTDVLLALPTSRRERRNAIIATLAGLPVHVRTLPSVADLASGKVTVRDFRELDVEDLLGRETVGPHTDLLAHDLQGKVVLVSGAGGSIGSELTRQIVAQHPRTLLLLDHSEYALYAIHQELQALCSTAALPVELLPLLGDVGDSVRMHALCATHRPSVIYHAAAYKHVPMVEANACEGVRNNVFGTLHLAQAAQQSHVARFVLISTDKAVRPTNVMGASKRLSEMVLQALAACGGQTCFAMVRFGNVLDSSGSVVPLFRKQIAAGGPLTVTHPEVTRYFMTIPEAAQLVIQAGAMAVGGDVFVLDMGEPVRIMELACRMVELSGLRVHSPAQPDGDIDIQITGLRPGEKLHEELLIGNDPQGTMHPRIMKAHEPFLPWDALCPILEECKDCVQRDDHGALRALLRRHVHLRKEWDEIC